MHVDHRALENVGSRPLDGHVHRDALGGRTDLAVLAGELGHEPAPSEQGAHLARRARAVERLVDEPAHRWKAREVRVDEGLRRLLRYADVTRERERGLPVQQRVVDDLGAPAEFVAVEPAVRAEHGERGAVVDVLATTERVGKRLVSDRWARTRSSICE